MESARFRFRDHLENGDRLEMDTSSEMSSVSSDADEDSEPESMTAKGIKRLCAELVELKSASDEEFYKNIYADYPVFLSIFEEAQVMESELRLLKSHILVEKQLVESLAGEIHLKLLSEENIDSIIEATFGDEESFISKLESHTDDLVEVLDTLLSEQRLDEALAVLEMEETAAQRIISEQEQDTDVLAFYNSLVSARKAMLVKKFTVLAENPRVNEPELLSALNGLCRLGESQLATQLLLRHYHSRMAKGIQRLQSSKSLPNDLYVKELSKFVFSVICQAAKCFTALYGEINPYALDLIEWAHEETGVFADSFNVYVKSVSETGGGLYMATESVDVAMIFCSLLESQRIVLRPCMMKHIRPTLKEVLEAQMRHFKRVIGIFTSCDTWALSRYLVSGILSDGFPHDGTWVDLEYCLLTNSGRKFITLLQAVIKDVYPLFALEMDSFIIEGLRNLFMEYISILEGAMTSRSDFPEGGGTTNNVAESILQQVSILLNISAVRHIFSSFLITVIHNTCPVNVKKATSYAVDCQQKQLDECILRVKETSDHLRSQFYQRVIERPVSVENSGIHIAESSIDEASGFTVDYDSPSLKFQVLFLELRKLEDFSEENAIEDSWLMDLLRDLIEAVFVSMSAAKDTWMAMGEDAEPKDVDNYKQLILDIQFLVEIARFEGCLSDDLLITAATLMSQLESKALSAGLDPERELSSGQWAARAGKSATKAIQMLLEIHLANTALDETGISSPPEEPYAGSLSGGSYVEDGMSILSEKFDKLEDTLEVGIHQEVFIMDEKQSLTGQSSIVGKSPDYSHRYHSQNGNSLSAHETSEDEDTGVSTLDETKTPTDISESSDELETNMTPNQKKA
uniref:Exocyst component Exo84 C-terminal domain-containing protein n=3 Tax=Kalanchoe fedtschenkoi TaxID=63787 RepID=A0A7N0TP69_KALFE